MHETLICYDISDRRRLARVHRALKRRALPLQYSVFLFTGTGQQLDRCLAELQTLIDPSADDLRAYPLPRRGLRWSLGKPTLPDGIVYGGLSANWATHAETAAASDITQTTGLQWIFA